MKPIISVIVPVYNSEKYLKDCIESILRQTFTRYELLLIDDKSEDHSLDICNQYANNNFNIKVFSNSLNKGASYARNVGLMHIKGEYVCFVDSDDTINKFMLEKMYEEACQSNAHIVQCQYLKKQNDNIDNKKAKTYAGKNAILNYLRYKDINGYIGGKMIKVSQINDSCFDSALRLGEDSVFIYNLLSKNCIVRCMESALYDYRIRNDSISNKNKFSEKIFDNFVQAEIITKITIQSKIQKRYANAFSFVLYYRILHDLLTYKVKDTYREQYNVLINKLKQTYLDAFLYGKLTTKGKAIIFLLSLFKRLWSTG